MSVFFQNNFAQEPQPSRLVITHAFNFGFPEQEEDLKIKTESDETQQRYGETRPRDGLTQPRDGETERDRLEDVKSEETHCEPETFVNDLNLEPKKKRGRRKVEKVC